MTMEFEGRVMTADELEVAFGVALATPKKVSFNSCDVPEALHQLIPYAMFWGVADDWSRRDVLKRTPDTLKINLKSVVARYDDQLDTWLAGPEALSPNPSDAYVAFSAMRMGADSL